MKPTAAHATSHSAARRRALQAVEGGGMGRKRISSRELLAGAVEVEIEHEAQVYRLRQTALGKLILTK
jgi:hemin uptake protein HemP